MIHAFIEYAALKKRDFCGLVRPEKWPYFANCSSKAASPSPFAFAFSGEYKGRQRHDLPFDGANAISWWAYARPVDFVQTGAFALARARRGKIKVAAQVKRKNKMAVEVEKWEG